MTSTQTSGVRSPPQPAPGAPAPPARHPGWRRRLRRPSVNVALDRLRLRLDARSSPSYHALPWLGLDTASRSAGTESRWEAMTGVLDQLQPATGLDVGCAGGWFSYQLAERGVATVGVEGTAQHYRTAIVSAQSRDLADVGVLVLRVTPATVDLLPGADCVVFLSIWHHMVKDFGQDAADEILRRVWHGTRQVMFFETGEDEMGPMFGLPPMKPDARTWIEGHLDQVCEGGGVQYLGRHDAFGPDGERCLRNLFAVVRTSEIPGWWLPAPESHSRQV